MEVAGQWPGPWAPNQQPNRATLLLSLSHTSFHNTFHLDCSLKSYETPDLIQHPHFMGDEETEAQKSFGDLQALSTGLLSPTRYKWRQGKVGDNVESATEFSHGSSSQFLVPKMSLEKQNHLFYHHPMPQFVRVLVHRWQECL